MSAEPRQSITARDVKFSDAMSSSERHWRFFSSSMMRCSSGSCSFSGVLPTSGVDDDMAAAAGGDGA